jgi:hypothetical protein
MEACYGGTDVNVMERGKVARGIDINIVAPLLSSKEKAASTYDTW